MFCHKEWKERIKITTFKDLDPNEQIPKGAVPLPDSQRPQGKIRVNITKPLDWYLPCQFESKEHGDKELLSYFIFYNMTLTPSNIYTSPDKGLAVDL